MRIQVAQILCGYNGSRQSCFQRSALAHVSGRDLLGLSCISSDPMSSKQRLVSSQNAQYQAD
jgi:hypothetical protein